MLYVYKVTSKKAEETQNAGGFGKVNDPKAEIGLNEVWYTQLYTSFGPEAPFFGLIQPRWICLNRYLYAWIGIIKSIGDPSIL